MAGKVLAQDPSIVIFDEPTRGVEGKAVMVISSYLPEVLSISDRILVARQGRIVAELDAATADERQVMYAAIR